MKSSKNKEKNQSCLIQKGIDKDIKSLYNFISYVLEARGKIRHVE